MVTQKTANLKTAVLTSVNGPKETGEEIDLHIILAIMRQHFSLVGKVHSCYQGMIMKEGFKRLIVLCIFKVFFCVWLCVCVCVCVMNRKNSLYILVSGVQDEFLLDMKNKHVKGILLGKLCIFQLLLFVIYWTYILGSLSLNITHDHFSYHAWTTIKPN